MFKKLASALIGNKNYYDTYPEYNKDRYSTLEKNFLRLSDTLMKFNEAPVALFGQPGAGKSTLLYKITEGQCNPKPIISQQTDATDWSINPEVALMYSYTMKPKYKYFIDTPGYGTSRHPLSSYKYFPFEEMSRTIFIIRGKLLQTDEDMFSCLIYRGLSDKILIVRTLAEDLTEDERMKVKVDLNSKLRYKHLAIPLIFASSRTGEGISSIQKWLWG